MNRLLEVGLRTWAVVQGAAAVAWLLGPFGPVGLGTDMIPQRLHGLLLPTILDGLFTGPMVGAHLTDAATQQQILDLTSAINTTPQGPVPGAYGDINLGWSVQFSSMGTGQGWIWVLLHVVPLVVMAVLWWLLANVVAQARSETVFTERNARRLVAAGATLLIGAPALSLLTWWIHTAVAASSQIADRVAVPPYSVAHLPWTAIATGVALVTLGRAWHRGATMEDDLGGLV